MGVEIQNLKKTFDGTNFVLNNVSIEVANQEFVAWLGPSGCGKTTLIRCLAGLESPSSGSIAVDQQTWFDSTQPSQTVHPSERGVGMVFQSYALWPHMSVYENVAFPLKMKGSSSADIKSKVMQALEQVELDKIADRDPASLSGGQAQRVALARALVARPKLLLLDEPLSNLDASLRKHMRHEIRKLQKASGLTAIIVTHDWLDAAEMCDRVFVMGKGEIIQSGSPEQIVSAPKTDFVKTMFESVR
jgi:iron(III) transport system ATP-binding protein